MSAFKWHTSLVMTPPTPSNEPCERMGHFSVQPHRAEKHKPYNVKGALQDRNTAPSAGTDTHIDQRYPQNHVAITISRHMLD